MTFDEFFRFVFLPAMGATAALVLIVMAVEGFRSWRSRPR